MDDSQRTHKTNVKMKRRLSFHHNNNQTLEQTLKNLDNHALPEFNIPQDNVVLNDSLVMSYLDTDNFDYNKILNNLLLNKNRSKTETLSIFTTIIDQLSSKIKEENKSLNIELNDNILKSLLNQINIVLKENKVLEQDINKLDKKIQSLSKSLSTKPQVNHSKKLSISTNSTSQNNNRRLSSYNKPRVTSFIGTISQPTTPRLNSASSSPDIWDQQFQNSFRQNSRKTSLEISDRNINEQYQLLLQRKQYDEIYDLVTDNMHDEVLKNKYEMLLKDLILNEMTNDLQIKRSIDQLKNIDSSLDIEYVFFSNRRKKYDDMIILKNYTSSMGIQQVLMILEYMKQVMKLYYDIFGHKDDIELKKFVQNILINELITKYGKDVDKKKYDDAIAMYFDDYSKLFNLNYYFILDDFRYDNDHSLGV